MSIGIASERVVSKRIAGSAAVVPCRVDIATTPAWDGGLTEWIAEEEATESNW